MPQLNRPHIFTSKNMDAIVCTACKQSFHVSEFEGSGECPGYAVQDKATFEGNVASLNHFRETMKAQGMGPPVKLIETPTDSLIKLKKKQRKATPWWTWRPNVLFWILTGTYGGLALILFFVIDHYNQ